MGWLSGWIYRKSHVINYAAGAGTNYQIKIVAHYGSGTDSGADVYLNGRCKTDFGDVRFTSSDGSTLLDYWMERKVDSDNAVFWVEVADDLSTADVTIYVYYGKSDAATTSNFDATFIFGDPFDSTTLNTDRWTSVDGSPVYSINAVDHYLEVTDMASNNWWNGKGFHSKLFSFPESYIIEDAYSSGGQRISHKSDAASEIFGALFCNHHGAWSSADYGVSFGKITDNYSANANFRKSAGVGGNEDYLSEIITGTTGKWYDLYTRIWKLGGDITVELDGTVRVIEANDEVPDRIHLGISRYSTYGFGNERFYAFKIRKYVSPEPAHGSWGSEETAVVRRIVAGDGLTWTIF